jgi:hypothetical protein
VIERDRLPVGGTASRSGDDAHGLLGTIAAGD